MRRRNRRQNKRLAERRRGRQPDRSRILIHPTEPPRRRPSHHGGLRRVRVWAIRAVIFGYFGALTDPGAEEYREPARKVPSREKVPGLLSESLWSTSTAGPGNLDVVLGVRQPTLATSSKPSWCHQSAGRDRSGARSPLTLYSWVWSNLYRWPGPPQIELGGL